MLVSIVIPIYNEKDNIGYFYEKITKALDKPAFSFEIIFVNDGSTDFSDRKLKAVALQDSKVKVIELRRNFGQTAAMMAGIDYSSGDIIITMDGDLQNDPEDITKLIEKLDEGYDVCSGWRKYRKDNWFSRVLPSKMANFLISKISRVPLKDYGCTLKAYRRDVIKDVRLYGEMHRFIPIYAAWQGANVCEIPVTHHARKHGKSKYGINRTFKVILDLMVIKFLGSYSQKPIYVFGGFGLFNFVLSFLSFALMIYYKYCGGKTFVETPLPQLVVLFFLMGFMSVLMGLIAEIQMRTYYESQNKPPYLIRKKRNFEKEE